MGNAQSNMLNDIFLMRSHTIVLPNRHPIVFHVFQI